MKTKQKVTVQKLSMSVPAEMKPLIRQRAASLDLTVSQYIRRLVNDEITVAELKVCAKNVVNTESYPTL